MEPPRFADPIAQYQYALSLHSSGSLDEAAAQYRQLLSQFPDNPLVLTGLGTVALQQGKLDEGIQLLGMSVEIEPNQPMAHCHLGLALRDVQRLDEALICFDRALALAPDFGDAYNFRGVVLQELKKFEEALESFDRALAIRPDFADAHCNRGNVLRLLGRPEEALASCSRAIALKPDFAMAFNNQANALQQLGRLDEALEDYDRALSLYPNYAEAWFNRGNTLVSLNRLNEALACHDRAIALRPAYGEAYCDRGTLLFKLMRLDEALRSFDQAILLNPLDVGAYNGRGIALKNLGRLHEAQASFDRAIALKPDDALAYWNKSLLRLLLGDFDQGWKLYEWRWKASYQKDLVRNFPQPLWLGEQSLAGKTLLIHAEQGFGDFIQCCRYASQAEAQGANVVLEAGAPLVSLLSTLKGNFTVIAQGQPLPPFDFHCPVMSLPLAFKTTVNSIPALIPYIHADPGKQEAWHQRLGGKTTPRIGLAWAGSRTQENDRNRSISVPLLKPLLQLPLDFHALQKEIRPEDVEILPGMGRIHLHHEQLNDFSDTAALVQEMDMVIAVDTSVAHLAGAQGKPVWILLPFMPDYRWMLDRADSPWYPTATLFRQPAAGDWPSVIEEVGARLRSQTTPPES